MSLRIKTVVDKFVEELKEALEADIQDRIMKEREMQSYIEEREREVAEREAAWKAELSRREAEIARQEARLKMEKENLEKEKSVLMGTASNQDNQDGALEITVSGEKYRCLRFSEQHGRKHVRLSGPCKNVSKITVRVKGYLKATTNLSKYGDGAGWVEFRWVDRLTLTGGGTFDGRVPRHGLAIGAPLTLTANFFRLM
ncbi:hypothetical protein CRYUN_Cryun18bG0073700 [Craigia yunnanensis]